MYKYIYTCVYRYVKRYAHVCLRVVYVYMNIYLCVCMHDSRIVVSIFFSIIPI